MTKKISFAVLDKQGKTLENTSRVPSREGTVEYKGKNYRLQTTKMKKAKYVIVVNTSLQKELKKTIKKYPTFTTENGVFCAECGRAVSYYSYRTTKKGKRILIYICENSKCQNENEINESMTIEQVYELGFELNKVLVCWEDTSKYQ